MNYVTRYKVAHALNGKRGRVSKWHHVKCIKMQNGRSDMIFFFLGALIFMLKTKLATLTIFTFCVYTRILGRYDDIKYQILIYYACMARLCFSLSLPVCFYASMPYAHTYTRAHTLTKLFEQFFQCHSQFPKVYHTLFKLFFTL